MDPRPTMSKGGDDQMELTQEQLEEVQKALEEMKKAFAKVAKTVVREFYRHLAKQSGKAGQIYLRTKSSRIRSKYRKAMLRQFMKVME